MDLNSLDFGQPEQSLLLNQLHMMGMFRKETQEEGIYKEVYVYFMGVLIYKMWFIRGVKTASHVFHSGEGLAQYQQRRLE
jgi:hypothetical protein